MGGIRRHRRYRRVETANRRCVHRRRAKGNTVLKNQLAGLNPIFLGPQPEGVEDDLRLSLRQPALGMSGWKVSAALDPATAKIAQPIRRERCLRATPLRP